MRPFLADEKAVKFIQNLSEGATDRQIIRSFVEESSRNSEWLKRIGADVVPSPPFKGFPGSALPSVPGAETVGPRLRVAGEEGGGGALWSILSQQVEDRNIPVYISTPAKCLVTGQSGEVAGVVALHRGKEIKVAAKRAVILACGGYQNDVSMHLNYLGQSYLYLGNPGNNGDGVRMAADVGADLWHMNAVAGCFGYKFPDFECSIVHTMPHAGFIYVDKTGRRFMDEAGTDMHGVWSFTSLVDMATLEKPRVPSFVIFDESTRRRGPVAGTNRGEISHLYQWSLNNSSEIKKGWILADDTIAGLARKLGLDENSLRFVVDRYNTNCNDGFDPDFGRSRDTLIQLSGPPFYAIPIWPSLFNTQGGPRRNEKGQVLDVWGNPIGGLYSAGELGSLWNRNYPGGGNITEALAFGRIAGRNAVGEKPFSS
jgi:succinate dehydrogenase/fumarate reductase flavoprotein subunit